MEVTFLQVAEYANFTEDHKLNVVGIFNNISALKFPAVHPEMHLVAQMTAQAPEYGRRFKLGIKLLNEDASQEIICFSADSTVPAGGKGLPVNMNFNFRLVNTKFDTPGTYEFSLLIDDDLKGTLPIEVIQLAEPQP
jgi:hypothetical protein